MNNLFTKMMTFFATLVIGSMSLSEYFHFDNAFSGTLYLVLALTTFNALQVMLFPNGDSND